MDPIRCRLLSELRTPGGLSAAALAGRIGLPRQKVNYHLRTLEAHGLVREESTKQWGGLTERRLVATAAAYVVSPTALGPIAPAEEPSRTADRLSAGYLVALAARVIREVGQLLRRSQETGKRLATLSIDTDVRFKSPEDRAAFSHELTAAVAALVAKYHDGQSTAGRWHRLMVGAYPTSQGAGALSQQRVPTASAAPDAPRALPRLKRTASRAAGRDALSGIKRKGES